MCSIVRILRSLCSKTALAVLILFVSSVTAATGQSSQILDGTNGVGLALYSELDGASLSEIGGYTAYSIAGIMDVGGYLARESETVGDREGTNTTIGFVYNVLPVKQQPGMPFSLQLRLNYGLTLVDRDLVVAELQARTDEVFDDIQSVESTRSTYTIAAGIMHDIRREERLSFRLGAEVAYRVKRATYSAVFTSSDDDDDDTLTEETLGFRETDFYVVPIAGASWRVPDGPILSVQTRAWLNAEDELVLRPELGIVFPHFQ